MTKYVKNAITDNAKAHKVIIPLPIIVEGSNIFFHTIISTNIAAGTVIADISLTINSLLQPILYALQTEAVCIITDNP